MDNRNGVFVRFTRIYLIFCTFVYEIDLNLVGHSLGHLNPVFPGLLRPGLHLTPVEAAIGHLHRWDPELELLLPGFHQPQVPVFLQLQNHLRAQRGQFAAGWPNSLLRQDEDGEGGTRREVLDVSLAAHLKRGASSRSFTETPGRDTENRTWGRHMKRTKHISMNSVFKTAVRLNGDFNVQYMRFLSSNCAHICSAIKSQRPQSGLSLLT